MSSERLQFMGRLHEKELRAETLKIKIRNLISGIRQSLDPFAAPEELDTDGAAAQALELAQIRIEYIGILAEIKAVKKALGKD